MDHWLYIPAVFPFYRDLVPDDSLHQSRAPWLGIWELRYPLVNKPSIL